MAPRPLCAPEFSLQIATRSEPTSGLENHLSLLQLRVCLSSWLAITIGGVILIGDLSLILFFTFGSFFGTFNDLCIAFAAILSALLAWMLYPAHRAYSPRLGQSLLTAALVGALVASIGSAFVIFDITGWFLAGLMNFFGNALVGLWLLGLNYIAQRRSTWQRRLVQFG